MPISSLSDLCRQARATEPGARDPARKRHDSAQEGHADSGVIISRDYNKSHTAAAEALSGQFHGPNHKPDSELR